MPDYYRWWWHILQEATWQLTTALPVVWMGPFLPRHLPYTAEWGEQGRG